MSSARVLVAAVTQTSVIWRNEMRFESFVGPAYQLRNIQAACQKCVNWFVEIIEVKPGKNGSVMQLVPTPGMLYTNQSLSGAPRGGYVASNGTTYYISGTTLYKLTVGATVGDVTATSIFTTLPTGTSLVEYTDNGVYLFMLVNNTAYKMDFATETVTLVTGGIANDFTSMTYMDTYIVFSITDTNQFCWTDPLGVTVPALNFASAEANSDQIVGLINHNQDLWVFGKKTTELWYNAGQGNSVFVQRDGVLIETGCVSAKTIKKIGNTLAWISIDDRGGPMFMTANGYQPQRMSTHPIEQMWQSSTYVDWSTAEAEVFQEGGHQFYALRMPGQDSVWVFDLTATQMLGVPCWHERKSMLSSGVLEEWLAKGIVFVNGQFVTGNRSNSKLFVLDKDTAGDDGANIIRERVTPHVGNEMKQVFYDRLQMDFMTGDTTNLYLDPQVMLQYSDDGGRTWSDEWWATSGMTGHYRTLVEWRRLGASRDRVFKIQCADGQYWAVSSASLDVRAGSH